MRFQKECQSNDRSINHILFNRSLGRVYTVFADCITYDALHSCSQHKCASACETTNEQVCAWNKKLNTCSEDQTKLTGIKTHQEYSPCLAESEKPIKVIKPVVTTTLAPLPIKKQDDELLQTTISIITGSPELETESIVQDLEMSEAGFLDNFSGLEIGLVVIGVAVGVGIGVAFAYICWVRPNDRKHAETIGTISRQGSRHNSEKSDSREHKDRLKSNSDSNDSAKTTSTILSEDSARHSRADVKLPLNNNRRSSHTSPLSSPMGESDVFLPDNSRSVDYSQLTTRKQKPSTSAFCPGQEKERSYPRIMSGSQNFNRHSANLENYSTAPTLPYHHQRQISGTLPLPKKNPPPARDQSFASLNRPPRSNRLPTKVETPKAPF